MGVNQNQNWSRMLTNCPTSRTKTFNTPRIMPEAQSKQHLYHQHRNNFEKDPAREITGNKQKQHKQAKYDQKLINAEAVIIIGKQMRGKLSF